MHRNNSKLASPRSLNANKCSKNLWINHGFKLWCKFTSRCELSHRHKFTHKYKFVNEHKFPYIWQFKINLQPNTNSTIILTIGWWWRCGGSRTPSNVLTAPQHKHSNWEHSEVLAFINCKHSKHNIQKELINPRLEHGFYVWC
jgi:hypothetical protein